MAFRRRLRALALGAAAALFVGLASLAYLNVQIPIPHLPQPTPPPPPQLTATDFDTVSYDFVSPLVGWAVDTRTNQSNGPADLWVFHTTDGAHRWETQLHLSVQSGSGAQVVFFDRLYGFVFVSGGPLGLYRTVDGGAHWTHPAAPPGIFGEITFADPDDGWVLANQNSAGPEQLYATTTGGVAWFEESNPPRFAAGLQIRSSGEGWLGTTGNEPVVLLSTDDGRSWQPRYLPSFPGDVSQCSSMVRLVRGNGVIAWSGCTDGQSDQVISFDAGLTWKPLPTPPPEDSSWERTTFVDSLHWWTMTGGALWKSSDSGQTWKYYGLQVDGWGDYEPQVLDANHAWAQLFHTGPNQSRLTGLSMTSDGGIHWTQVNAPRP